MDIAKATLPEHWILLSPLSLYGQKTRRDATHDAPRYYTTLQSERDLTFLDFLDFLNSETRIFSDWPPEIFISRIGSQHLISLIGRLKLILFARIRLIGYFTKLFVIHLYFH